MEQLVSRSPAQSAAGGAGRGAGSVLVALAEADHLHEWRPLPESVGLFVCAARGCPWFAVCPGCLGSLEAALSVRDGLRDLVLYWCLEHQGECAP